MVAPPLLTSRSLARPGHALIFRPLSRSSQISRFINPRPARGSASVRAPRAAPDGPNAPINALADHDGSELLDGGAGILDDDEASGATAYLLGWASHALGDWRTSCILHHASCMRATQGHARSLSETSPHPNLHLAHPPRTRPPTTPRPLRPPRCPSRPCPRPSPSRSPPAPSPGRCGRCSKSL
jgi:hypothetical protein